MSVLRSVGVDLLLSLHPSCPDLDFLSALRGLRRCRVSLWHSLESC